MSQNDRDIPLDKSAYLREVDIFQDLAASEIEELGRRAPMKRVAAGTVFYAPDNPTEVLFILKEGRVRLYHLLPDGRALTTAMLDAGVVFGEMTLLGQDLHGSFAEAATPCVLCLMSRQDVKTLLLGDPRVALRIAEALGRRLIDAERRLLDFAYRRVPERVALLLAQLAAKAAPGTAPGAAPEIVCTHEELADLAGTYRETVTKALSDLRGRGLIELQRGRIIVRDLEGLRRIAPG
jgi:CRP-like cAMP-binding protein